MRGKVPRPLAISVEHTDIYGTERITLFERGLARLVAYEVDHLHGKLYRSRLREGVEPIPVPEYHGTGKTWQTGLRVETIKLLGERVHPKTGHLMSYILAKPQIRITVGGLRYLHGKLGGVAPLRFEQLPFRDAGWFLARCGPHSRGWGLRRALLCGLSRMPEWVSGGSRDRCAG